MKLISEFFNFMYILVKLKLIRNEKVNIFLENSGILGKMKAQLRAHVYTTLESNHVPKHSKLSNQALTNFLSSTSGRLIFCLVR